MYTPEHNRITNQKNRDDLIQKLTSSYPFATFITLNNQEDITINHLPFLYNNETKILTSHIAKMNPLYKSVKQQDRGVVIFQGPHMYISPNYYLEKKRNVPTWNYVVAHARGRVTIIQDKNEIEKILDQSVKYFENKYQTFWQEQLSHDHKQQLLGAIVGIEIFVDGWEIKCKIGQNKGQEDFQSLNQHVQRLAPDFFQFSIF